MRASPPPDLLGTYSSTYAPTNYYGSTSAAITTQPYIGFDSINTTRNTSNLLSGAGLLGPSSPPRRRYSIGGLPSASITEYLNLMQSANESAHLSNLLNETSKSITRSSQILGVSNETSAMPGFEAVLAGQFGDSSGDACEFQSDNLLTMPLANFSSQPNIYTMPNYTTSSAFYEPLSATSLGHPNHAASSYLSHQKPFANYASYARPTHNVSFTHPFASASSAYAANRPISNLAPYQNSALSLSRQNLFMPAHHTSNPALSSGAHNTWIPSAHCRFSANDPYATSHYQQPSSLPGSYHHHHHPPPFSSSAAGYANQHFDHHYFQTPLHAQQPSSHLSKLDLDYSKQGETQKRQVSFKFDVDTLSVDS